MEDVQYITILTQLNIFNFILHDDTLGYNSKTRPHVFIIQIVYMLPMCSSLREL